MFSLNLPAIAVNHNVIAAVRASLEEDGLEWGDLADMVCDIHAALYKATFAATEGVENNRLDPTIGVMVQSLVVQIVNEAMRLGAERHVFNHVLSVPVQEE
ncbi:hypothetical protein SEA_JONJAMES_136 [Gordonia Phage JonJames]|nr:hypothetical protein SEA_JONJAMES_136 [Gordonia Phage JonJames]